ncbi:hypothetical protein SO802_000203 [Lithocarpus litseifolius]|uniref:Uncharacterized protein n=1 Tax=Lithocarpus litseifolius TaxID=425828 RepID=A0AAW2DUM2_9ROSI
MRVQCSVFLQDSKKKRICLKLTEGDGGIGTIQKFELTEGDGGIGTILKLTFPPGTPGFTDYKEKFTKLDNEKRLKEAEVTEGGYLEVGITFHYIWICL